MKKRLLCFDVDGTLRDNVTNEVSSSTRHTLQLLKDQGYLLAISSGRGVDSLKKTGIMELIAWDGFVCNNGQVVLDGKQQVLFQAVMNKEAVEKTIEVANQLGFAVILKSHPRLITREPNEYVFETQRYFQNMIPDVGVYHGQDVDAMTVHGPHGYDYEPFTHIEGINVLPGESTYADLTIKGVSKATGISKLLKLYQLDGYIAFGDSLNDMDMFEHADISIAMGQGNDRLKAVATFVTKSIDQDGIEYACRQIHLIP